jgi:PhnB protein
MPQPIPYLIFHGGTCAEAMDFYAEALGGKIIMKMSHADIPGYEAAPGTENLMMHVRLGLPDGGVLYAGDAQPGLPEGPRHEAHIALTYPTVEEARRVFDALSAGGEVIMPMSPSFWAEEFGMANDRFGMCWMINGNEQPIG